MAERGRPTKYTLIETRLDEIEKLAGYGLTDVEIADILEISRATLSNYKNDYPEFLDILKRGKLKAASNVIGSLYKRTQGYEYEETTTEGKSVNEFDDKGNIIGTKIVPTFIKKVKKYIAPDVTACMCWLNNQRRQDWRPRQPEQFEDNPQLIPEFDKMSNEELKKFVSQSVN